MSCIEKSVVKLKSGKECLIRSAVPEDGVALVNYARAVLSESEFNVTEPDEFQKAPDEESRWIEGVTKSPNDLALIAEMGGHIVGFVDFHAGKQRRLSHRGAFGISVKRSHWNLGIAKALLSSLIAWARAHPHIHKVSLAVLSNNESAIGLYRKMGFVEEGKRIREIKMADGSFIDDYLMYLWVK